MMVKIEIIKDYNKQGRQILKKGATYLVSSDTANQLIEVKKVAQRADLVKRKPKKSK